MLDSPVSLERGGKAARATLVAYRLSPKLSQELSSYYTLTVLEYRYRDQVESCWFLNLELTESLSNL